MTPKMIKKYLDEQKQSILSTMDEMSAYYSYNSSLFSKRLVEVLLNDIPRIDALFDQSKANGYDNKSITLVRQYIEISLSKIMPLVKILHLKSPYQFVPGCSKDDFKAYIEQYSRKSVKECLKKIADYLNEVNLSEDFIYKLVPGCNKMNLINLINKADVKGAQHCVGEIKFTLQQAFDSYDEEL